MRDANRGAFETVVVRPRFVWGRGDTTLLPTMLKLVRDGRFAWVSGGLHRTSTTHVDNVIEGLMLGASRGAAGNVYFVTDGEPVVFREFVTDCSPRRASSRPSRSLPGTRRLRGRGHLRGGMANAAAVPAARR